MSLPLPAHVCADLACLKGHLETQPLPDGWIGCADSTTDGTLVLAKLSVNVQVLTANATLLLKVDEELRWSVSCHGILGQSRVLTSIPPRLNSAGTVLDLLSTLQQAAVCCGNML